MHNPQILIIALVFLFAKAEAQDASMAKAEIRYLASCVVDTVTNKVMTDTFCLRYNDTQSLFYNTYTYANDSLRHNDYEAWSQKLLEAMGDKSQTKPYDPEQEYYILADHQQGTYVYEEEIGTGNYQYTDSLPHFDWQLLPDEKDIAGHACRKAMCTYMGRTYEAWYATGLLPAIGPWKFCRLPGMVMEVYDTRRQYIFQFISQYPCVGEIALIPQKRFKVTKGKYFEQLAKYLQDPVGTFSAGAGVSISFGEGSDFITQPLKEKSRHAPMEIM